MDVCSFSDYDYRTGQVGEVCCGSGLGRHYQPWSDYRYDESPRLVLSLPPYPLSPSSVNVAVSLCGKEAFSFQCQSASRLSKIASLLKSA